MIIYTTYIYIYITFVATTTNQSGLWLLNRTTKSYAPCWFHWAEWYQNIIHVFYRIHAKICHLFSISESTHRKYRMHDFFVKSKSLKITTVVCLLVHCWFSSDEFGAIFNVRNAGNGPCTPKPGTSSGRVAVLWTSRSIIWRWPAEDLCRKPPGGSTFTFARCYIQSYLNLMLVHPIIKWYLGSGIWNAVNCNCELLTDHREAPILSTARLANEWARVLQLKRSRKYSHYTVASWLAVEVVYFQIYVTKLHYVIVKLKST